MNLEVFKSIQKISEAVVHLNSVVVNPSKSELIFISGLKLSLKDDGRQAEIKLLPG